MRLFLCWVCPPLAVLLCGKPFSAILNAFLCLFLWLPGVAHARDTVLNHFADKRNKRELRVINRPAWVNDVYGEPKTRIKGRRKLVGQQIQEALAQPVPMDPAIGQNGTRFRKRA